MLQYHFDQIAKLLSGELVSFDIGRQPPLSIENHSVQGVQQLGLVQPGVDGKQGAETLYDWRRSSQKVPVSVGVPGTCIVGQCIWVIVDGIKAEAEQYQIVSHLLLEALLHIPQVVRKPETIFGKRAMGVEKIQDQYLAGKPGHINWPSVLVRQDGARHPFPDSQRSWVGCTCLKPLYHRQAAGSKGLLLKIVELANCDAFRVAQCPLIQNRKIDQLSRCKPGEERIFPYREFCHAGRHVTRNSFARQKNGFLS